MLQRLPSIIVMTSMMLVSIILAVYVTGTQQVKANVAVICRNTVSNISSKQLNITYTSSEPPLSSLVKKKYDAYIIYKNDGTYEIKTLRNEQFKNMLSSIIQNPDGILPPQSTDRGVGVNIIGFLLMFLLMQTFMNLFTFADDKEKGQLKRIMTSPISLGGYLTAHCIYCLSMYLPAFIMLWILKEIGFTIGFNLLEYAFLLILIGTIGVSFALLLNMFFDKPDNASMLGSSILVLTTVLAGGFYSFSRENSILDNLVKVLPQKQIIDFTQYIQNGNYINHLGPIYYVLGLSALFFVISISKLRMEYINKV